MSECRTPVALVTGASGYVGHHLCESLLVAGWRVRALVRPTSDLRGLDSRATARVERLESDGGYEEILGAVKLAAPDVVFHLATMAAGECSPGQIGELVESNITFGVRLLAAMAQCGCTAFVNAGSYWEYAADGVRAPNSLYAASKAAFAQYIPYYVQLHGLRSLTLVLFDVYGPWDWRRKFVPLLAAASRDGRTLNLSPGDQMVEMTHVTDVAAGFVQAGQMLLQQPQGGHSIYALGGAERRTLREVVATAERAWSRRVHTAFGAQPHRANQVMIPVTTLTNLPGWRPRYTLEAGLTDVDNASAL